MLQSLQMYISMNEHVYGNILHLHEFCLYISLIYVHLVKFRELSMRKESNYQIMFRIYT